MGRLTTALLSAKVVTALILHIIQPSRETRILFDRLTRRLSRGFRVTLHTLHIAALYDIMSSVTRITIRNLRIQLKHDFPA